MNLRRWLTVGIGVKRWVLVAFLGLLVLALGVAHLLRQATASLYPDGIAGAAIDVLTLQFLPYQLRGLIAGTVGFTLFLYGAYRLVRALVDPFALWDRDQPMVEVIYQKRFLARGPRVVAIGGGTGLSALLRGLKEHTSNLTAVVTVADDGGSSGVLRAELGIPAVGDIRNCIVALADAEPLMGRLLQYRFPGGSMSGLAPESEPGLPPARDAEALADGVGGHALGNLILAALVELEHGDFEEGVRELNRVLAVRGRVVPATGTVLTLHARLRDGSEVDGQSRVARCADLERVWIMPEDVQPTDDALRAIEDAELIVIGPGSLYTSILPALLVPGIREAIAASGALVIFATNVATQAGETAGLRPRRPPRHARVARRGPPGGRRRGQQPPGCRATRGLAGRARAASLAAEGRSPTAPRARRRRGRGERPPSRPCPARGRRDRGLGARGRPPEAPHDRPRRARVLAGADVGYGSGPGRRAARGARRCGSRSPL